MFLKDKILKKLILNVFSSIGEWEIYLIENSSFVFYGMEKLMSYLPPHKLSALNIPGKVFVFFLVGHIGSGLSVCLLITCATLV